jgi:hypothetical protein
MRQADFGFEPDEKYSTSWALDVMGSPCDFGGADKPNSPRKILIGKILTGKTPESMLAQPPAVEALYGLGGRFAPSPRIA